MLAEEIGLSFFGESGFEDAGARATKSLRVGKGERLGFSGSVLFDGEKGGRAAAFGEYLANAMAGRFGRDHGDIDVGGCLDGAEANVESVREH